MPKLTISLVTFNGVNLLSHCLQSIRDQTFQDFNLIVFDNHSTDATRDLVSHIYPEARIIAWEKNIGFAAGHNAVISESVSPYVCVLNQDVILDSEYLMRCIQRIETCSRCGAVQGKILRVQELTHTPFSDTIDTCGIALYPFFHHFSSLGEHQPEYAYEKEREIFGVAGTAAIYGRKALEDCAVSLGNRTEYFDEDFFMYKEDVDLAYRLQKFGWQALYIPSARAYHIRTAKSALLFFGRARPEKVNEWSYRNHFFVLIKNMSTKQFLRSALGIFVYELAKVLYHGIRAPRMLISALRGVLHLRRRMMQKRAIIFSK